MRKRQRTSAGQRKPKAVKVWTEGADSGHFLAWLNHCVEHGINFDTTIIDYLHSTRGKDFSARQIKDRMRYFWTNFGRLGAKSVKDLYAKGTSCLLDLPDSWKEEVHQASSALRPLQPRYKLRSTPSLIATRSRTWSKSESRLDASSSSGLSTHASDEFKGLELGGVVQPKTTTSRLAADLKPKSEISDSVLLVPTPARTTEDQGLPHQEHLQLSVSQECRRGEEPGIPFVEHVAPDLVENLRAQISSLEQQLEDKKREVQVVRNELESQECNRFSLLNRLSMTQQEYFELRHCADAAEHRREDVVMLRDLRYENSLLKDRHHGRSEFQASAASLENDQLGPCPKDIRRDIGLIEREIADACSSLRIRQLTSLEPIVPGPNAAILETWANVITGTDFNHLVSHAVDMEISEQDILRSCIAAGLASLVFEPCFPDILAVQSPLLDHYRRNILTKDGEEALAQLDILSLQSLISDNQTYDSIINPKALRITECILKHLDSFLEGESDIPEGGEISFFESFSHEPPAELFQAGVVRAIKLRSLLYLSKHRYATNFVRPGAKFDPCTMIKDGWAAKEYFVPQKVSTFSKKLPRPQTEEVVKLCLFPALYSRVEKVEYGHEVLNIEPLGVLARQDMITDVRTTEGVSGMRLVSKAVVLL